MKHFAKTKVEFYVLLYFRWWGGKKEQNKTFAPRSYPVSGGNVMDQSRLEFWQDGVTLDNLFNLVSLCALSYKVAMKAAAVAAIRIQPSSSSLGSH